MESKKQKLLKKGKYVKKVHDLMDQPIFNKNLIQVTIQIPFKNITSYLEEEFIKYAKKNILNRCLKEGYISDNHIKIISYSAGKMVKDSVLFDVIYELNVCYPNEGMQFKCKIQSITKIGIKGILSDDEEKNPIVVFASRMHNNHIIMNDEEEELDDSDNPFKKIFSTGDEIMINVIGYRFEINDPSIYVLAEIIQEKPKLIY